MTLRELQAACEDMANENPELLDEEVFMTADYGDHGHNESAIAIRCLVHTLVSNGPHARAYSHQGLEVHHNDEDEPYEDELPPHVRPALVLGFLPEYEYDDITGARH